MLCTCKVCKCNLEAHLKIWPTVAILDCRIKADDPDSGKHLGMCLILLISVGLCWLEKRYISKWGLYLYCFLLEQLFLGALAFIFPCIYVAVPCYPLSYGETQGNRGLAFLESTLLWIDIYNFPFHTMIYLCFTVIVTGRKLRNNWPPRIYLRLYTHTM